MAEVRRLINTYDQLMAAGGGVAISYNAYAGRAHLGVVGWRVWRVHNGKQVDTDPKAHWSDRGAKTFSVFGNGGAHAVAKAAALEKAKAWASAKFGVKEWARNRAGDYVSKEINDKFPLPKRERTNV